MFWDNLGESSTNRLSYNARISSALPEKSKNNVKNINIVRTI